MNLKYSYFIILCWQQTVRTEEWLVLCVWSFMSYLVQDWMASRINQVLKCTLSKAVHTSSPETSWEWEYRVLSIGWNVYIPPAQKSQGNWALNLSAILNKILRFNLLNASLKSLGSRQDMHVAEACSDLTGSFSSVLVLLAPVETGLQCAPSAVGISAWDKTSNGSEHYSCFNNLQYFPAVL